MSSLQSSLRKGKSRQLLLCLLSSLLLMLSIFRSHTFHSAPFHHGHENYFAISCEKISTISIQQQHSTQKLPPYESFTFKQRLDHFDFSNDQTFSQRYFVF